MLRIPTWVCVALLAAALWAAPATGSEHGPTPISLVLDPEFHLENGTYLIGEIAFASDLIRHPGAVGATGLDLPDGPILVCPVEHGAQGVVPGLAALGMECRGGERHENPTVSFGSRTWLQFEGTYRNQPLPDASVNLLVPEGPQGDPLWLTTPAGQALSFAFAAQDLRFSPTTSGSRVTITDSGEDHQYNGTDWAFIFERAGTATLHATGFHATLATPLSLSLGSGRLAEVEAATRPRVFLDLQELIMNADAREAVGNATRHFTVGLVPHFQNGALIGNINGTINQVEMAGKNGTLVHGDDIQLTLDGVNLEGSGAIRFVLYDQTLWLEGNQTQGAPWLTIALLWVVAATALLAGLPWRPPPTWQAWTERALPWIGLLLWDRISYGLFDVSALNLFLNDAPIVHGLRVAALQIAGYSIAWFLLYVPGRTILRRILPQRVRLLAPAVAYPLFVLYMTLAPASLIAFAELVTRF